MSILFGHPTGNPNSHQAALAHLERGCLEAFCVPWMPTPGALGLLQRVPGLRSQASRLERRYFPPLATAKLVQGKLGEWKRLTVRALGRGDEGLAYQANDWLMHTMARECRRKSVTAVHSYEDCSLWQFEEAKRLGKACIYDMPIGYYSAWEQKQTELAKRYVNWLPPDWRLSNRWVRPEQKRREMVLADVVIAPSCFVKDTILRFHADKNVALAPYGVDLEFWRPQFPALSPSSSGPLRFVFAGQCSIRKGTPVLLDAWKRAGLRDASLSLVGSWHLAPEREKDLPDNVSFIGPVSREALRSILGEADVFVFPTFFEGRALAVAEALACGLPVITTAASGMSDLVNPSCGRVIPSGSEDQLVDALRWFAEKRDRIPAMRAAARAQAETCTWAHYRECVSDAVADFV